VLRTADGTVVCVGVAGEGTKLGEEPIEGSLADRLWTHKDSKSKVGKRLACHHVQVIDCDVQIRIENDLRRRLRIESYGIIVFEPIGNNSKLDLMGDSASRV
jgi:hypothetical protein